MNNDLDLPFEESPRSPMDLSDGVLAGGVVLLAAVVQGPDGPIPALVSRFARPDGSGFYSPVTLVLTADQLPKLAQLTADAIASATKAAAA